MAKAQFNRNDVLDKSIGLFWESGFSASSMQQVVKATGLNPGSIYHSFGSKEALFKESLVRYSDTGRGRMRAAIDGAPSVLEGIRNILQRMVREAETTSYCSCFLVKTQMEFGSQDNELHRLASSKLSLVEALFREYLETVFEPDLARHRATSVMMHIFGVRVYGYHAGSGDRMRDGLREGLPWLPWESR